MVCQCPKCQKIYQGPDGAPCPSCGWEGIYRAPRSVIDLDQMDEDRTRERFHHKVDSEAH